MISITYSTSTETDVTQEFSTADELKTFITNNNKSFTGAMKVVCDNSITSCRRMFGGCGRITSLDLSELDTSKVTDMQGMFYYCSSLTSLDVTHFDTSAVTDMESMFYSCSSLTSLDLTHFDISALEYVSTMFSYCSSLETIYCEKNWKSDKILSSLAMFVDCTKLKGAISYDSSKTNINYANPDTGYFSYLPRIITFLANLDMLQNQIKNFVLDKPEATPVDAVVGQIYYNKTDDILYIYNGTTWDKLLGSLVLGVNGKTGNVNITNADLGAESMRNKIAILSTENTDIEYPNAKCVYDNFANKIKNAANTNLVINRIWYGTQAQYDAISTKDANTEYNIIQDVEVVK